MEAVQMLNMLEKYGIEFLGLIDSEQMDARRGY